MCCWSFKNDLFIYMVALGFSCGSQGHWLGQMGSSSLTRDPLGPCIGSMASQPLGSREESPCCCWNCHDHYSPLCPQRLNSSGRPGVWGATTVLLLLSHSLGVHSPSHDLVELNQKLLLALASPIFSSASSSPRGPSAPFPAFLPPWLRK